MTHELEFEQETKAVKGKYVVEHYRNGELLNTMVFENDIVNVGKDYLLDSFFRNQSQPAAWYIGLVDNSGWTAFASADTPASHSGWNEFTNYSQSNRVAWGPDAAASQSITNTTAATFSITGSGTLKGVFIASNNTKGSTSNTRPSTLWSTAPFTSTVPVVNGDELKITYTLSC